MSPRARSKRAPVIALLVLLALIPLIARLTKRSASDEPAHPGATVSSPASSSDAVQAPLASSSIAEEPRTALASETPAPSSSNAPRWILHVVESDGSPAAGLDCALVEHLGSIEEMKTSDIGTLERDPAVGRGTLYVAKRGGLAWLAEVALGEGAHTLQLPRDLSVSGVVRENGSAPSKPIALHLDSSVVPTTFEVPLEVNRWLSSLARIRTGRTEITGEGGEFLFADLPALWSGAIVLPDTLRFVVADGKPPNPRRLELPAPLPDLVIDLERLPCFTCRIVAADGTTPVANARVKVAISWNDGSNSASQSDADEDGRLELALRSANLRKLEVTYSGPEGQGLAQRTFLREQMSADLDVGTLPLSPGRELEFHVVDGKGTGLPFASVGVVGNSTRVHADARGQGFLLGVPSDAAQLSARQVGFWTKVVDLASSETSVVIELAASNRLLISVRSPSGSGLSGMRVELETERAPLFPDTRGGMPDFELAPKMAETYRGNTTEQSGRSWTEFRTAFDGALELRNVAPDVPIVLRVLDAIGKPVHEETLAPLGADEDREHVVDLPRAPLTLKGIVHDETGAPVAGARVQVSADGSSDTNSDLEGRFQCGSLFTERVDVVVSKKGYASARLASVGVPPSTGELSVVLERGHELAVSVVDTRGRAVAGGRVVARDDDGLERDGENPSAGAYVLRDLPPTPVTLELQLAGRIYTLQHAGVSASERFEVPVHGKVDVAWTVAPLEHARRTVQLECTTLALEPLYQTLRGDGRGVSSFGAVLPGEYVARLWQSDPSTPEPILLAEQRVTVAADETAKVELAP